MKLPLAYYSDPILRKRTERIDCIDDQLLHFVDDMIETMHACDGIGLAAPQVYKSISLFITCVPYQKPNGKWMPGNNRVFINPEIISQSDEVQTFSEGCLSIPHIYFHVTRPESIIIQATDLEGNRFEESFSGFEATNFMHENDHLNGILIIDYISVEARRSLEQLIKDSLVQNDK